MRASLVLARRCRVRSRRGCATIEPPKPWEKRRSRAARCRSTPTLEAKIEQHIYTSKEAATGGYGVGGGGCGCN